MAKLRKKAGGIIYAKNIDAYLLVYNGTKWGFPKGSAKKEETEEECAKREIYEETGYIVENIEKYKKKNIILISFYIIEIENAFVSNPIDTNEVKDIQWFTLSEIRKMHENNLVVSNIKSFFRLPKLCSDNNQIEEKENKISIEQLKSLFLQKSPVVLWNEFIQTNKNIEASYNYFYFGKEKTHSCVMSITDSNTNTTQTFSFLEYSKKDARHKVIEKAILSCNYKVKF